MAGTRGAFFAAAALAAALITPATVGARPADVVITNTTVNPVKTELVGQPVVKVNSTVAEPVITSERKTLWTVGMNVSSPDGSSSACSQLPQPPSSKAVLLKSAFVSVGGATSAAGRVYLTGHFDAGGFLPLLNFGLPAFDANNTARLATIDLPYVGGSVGARGSAELQSLYFCYSRSSSSGAISYNVVVTGEQYTP